VVEEWLTAKLREGGRRWEKVGEGGRRWEKVGEGGRRWEKGILVLHRPREFLGGGGLVIFLDLLGC
jgi:hypothetical protein